MLKALWLLALLIVVGCAQSPAPDGEKSPAPSRPLTGGSVSTEGGGNEQTLAHNFWHETEKLATCLQREFERHPIAKTQYELELHITALNLWEFIERGHNVKLRDHQPTLFEMDEGPIKWEDEGKKTLYLHPGFYSAELFSRNLALLRLTNRYGSKRMEWPANFLGAFAYQCSPGTVL